MKEVKTDGITYLRYSVAKLGPKNKYVCIPISVARKIMEQSQGFTEVRPFNVKSNSVKAAALLIGVSPKEMCDRLNGKHPNQSLSDIAEIKTKLKALEEIGDKICSHLPEGHPLIREWVKTKIL